jgi:serine/threonine protein kinase/transcriptional regulator with XRE-family HTH domain
VRPSIGEYRLLQKLGQGAAGEVYLATPTIDKPFAKAGDPLAIKVYKSEILSQPAQLERIRREFKVGSEVPHPNLVRIHEMNEASDDEPPFLVMEWVDGVTLEAWIGMFHPIPADLTLRIVRQLVSAVEALHGDGVTHRDIKPANIMISSSFEAKLMDFGVVHAQADSPITPSDKFLGTIRNSSPELLFGQNPDERTDLYSLGTVIFALQHGEQVFADENQFARLIELVRDAQPAFQAHAGTDETTVALLALSRDLLRKNAAERPQSATAIVERIAGLCEAHKKLDLPTPVYGYIGTALTGLERDARSHIIFASSKIAETAKKHGLYVYQPRKATDPLLHPDVEATAVYKLDRKRVVGADLLLLLLNKPSFGVGQELEIAASYGKPTLLISEQGVNVSRMLMGSPANLIDHVVYTTPEDLERKLDKSLERALPKVRRWKQETAKLQKQQLGPRIRELREAAGYRTPADLADAVGLSPQLVAMVESGEFENLGIEVLNRICGALETPLGEALAGVIVRPSKRERDPNLLRLEALARKLNWPASEFFELRDDYRRQLAARGEDETITDEQWLLRRNALERRTLRTTEEKASGIDEQPQLF